MHKIIALICLLSIPVAAQYASGTAGYITVNGVQVARDPQPTISATDPGCTYPGRVWGNITTTTTVFSTCDYVSGVLTWIQGVAGVGYGANTFTGTQTAPSFVTDGIGSGSYTSSGSTSGSAGIGCPAICGTPDFIYLPTTTGAPNSILRSAGDSSGTQQANWGGNCTSSASPAICGSAPSGSVVIATSATAVVVDTTAVTANSQIFVQPDTSLGTKLSVTCNSDSTIANFVPVVTARTAGVSFTITITGSVSSNPACYSYFVVN